MLLLACSLLPVACCSLDLRGEGCNNIYQGEGYVVLFEHKGRQLGSGLSCDGYILTLQ